MIREASIRIRLSRLQNALLKAGLNKDELELFLNTIISQSKKDNLSHRSMIIDSKKKEKIAVKSLTSTDSDIEMFNNILFFMRKKAKHRIGRKFAKGTKNYTIVMKASELAVDFCNEFKLRRKEGFTKYISIFIKLSGNKVWLDNLINKYEYYCEYYEAERLVLKDKNVAITNDLINLFEGEIMRVTGLSDETLSMFDKASFVKAAEICVDIGISGTDYMAAQFEGLDFLGGIPHISQLSNDKARSRVIKYMAKHKIKSGLKPIVKKLDWNKILGDA